MHQVFIASKPIVNKSKRSTNLLLENPLAFDKPSWLQTCEPKPRGQTRKNAFEKCLIIKSYQRKQDKKRICKEYNKDKLV